MVAEKKDIVAIGKWTHTVYLEEDTSIELDDIILSLNVMECGLEFARSYEELDKIADDLIAGKKVIL